MPLARIITTCSTIPVDLERQLLENGFEIEIVSPEFKASSRVADVEIQLGETTAQQLVERATTLTRSAEAAPQPQSAKQDEPAESGYIYEDAVLFRWPQMKWPARFSYRPRLPQWKLPGWRRPHHAQVPRWIQELSSPSRTSTLRAWPRSFTTRITKLRDGIEARGEWWRKRAVGAGREFAARARQAQPKARRYLTAARSGMTRMGTRLAEVAPTIGKSGAKLRGSLSGLRTNRRSKVKWPRLSVPHWRLSHPALHLGAGARHWRFSRTASPRLIWETSIAALALAVTLVFGIALIQQRAAATPMQEASQGSPNATVAKPSGSATMVAEATTPHAASKPKPTAARQSGHSRRRDSRAN